MRLKLWLRLDPMQASSTSGALALAALASPLSLLFIMLCAGPVSTIDVYSFCGSNMAKAFKPFATGPIDRVVILGPSHHVDFQGCALTTASLFETPLGKLQVDTESVQQLHSSGKFPYFPLHFDEAEHSIEMHLPMLQTILGQEACRTVKVLSVVVSKLSTDMQKDYAKELSEYCKGEGVRVCLSSDFCHWGPRFQYFNLPADAEPGKTLSEQIERLDRAGVEAIATGDPQIFREYIESTKNTICGQIPILIFMEMANMLGWDCSYNLVSYDRSWEHIDPDDSSVSYVACHIRKRSSQKRVD